VSRRPQVVRLDAAATALAILAVSPVHLLLCSPALFFGFAEKSGRGPHSKSVACSHYERRHLSEQDDSDARLRCAGISPLFDHLRPGRPTFKPARALMRGNVLSIPLGPAATDQRHRPDGYRGMLGTSVPALPALQQSRKACGHHDKERRGLGNSGGVRAGLAVVVLENHQVRVVHPAIVVEVAI